MDMKRNIMVIGGGGYVGAVLVPYLLKQGHKVTVYDIFLYGSHVLQPHENLRICIGDIRDITLFEEALLGCNSVIHLACISNDPSFELDPKLGKSINLDSFEPLVDLCKAKGIERFIFASSSSVYGIKDEPNVIESMSLEPITDYSMFKVECENILLKYTSTSFVTTIVRPATVCGYSPRQRLDVIVNIFANQGYNNRKISVFGGDQLRPNIHIQDMVRLYQELIVAPKDKINGKIYNAGYFNFSVSDIANQVKEVLGEDIEITVVPTDDNRSYHISSEKVKTELGFIPKFSIKDAAKDLKHAFDNRMYVDSLNNSAYFNIKLMQNINLK